MRHVKVKPMYDRHLKCFARNTKKENINVQNHGNAKILDVWDVSSMNV